MSPRRRRTPDTSVAVPDESAQAEVDRLITADADVPAFSMFSAATFFDVLAQAPDAREVQVGEPSAPLSRPALVAFYGFRGGAGRTLALAHTAVMLARRGMRVAAVDLDIGAPGLHVALGVELPDTKTGAVPLLRLAVDRPASEPLPVGQHLLAAAVPENLGRLVLLPAGAITRTYLAQIEELGVDLWHAHTKSPLRRLLDDLCEQEQVDAVFLDCRTGFDGLAATTMFHVADLVIVFLPLSDQIWDGVDVLLDAARAAKSHRENRPALLFVPSMVPPGEEGRRKTDRFIQRLRKTYVARLTEILPDPDAADPDTPTEPWLNEGIGYDARVATLGRVDAQLLHVGAWGIYRPLVDRLADMVSIGPSTTSRDDVNTKKILSEIAFDKLAFAESTSIEKLVMNFVAPVDVMRAIDRSTALLVGAKGSGKTWLWRYLIHAKAGPVSLPKDVSFVVGHAPDATDEGQDLQLSADALKELEKDCDMRRRGTHKAFWLLYALARLSQHVHTLAEALPQGVERRLRSPLSDLLQSRSISALRPSLQRLLETPNVATLAEDLITGADRLLIQADSAFCLTYDGLDTGFQTGRPIDWRGRQDRFVTALLLVLAEWRTRLKRIYFKIFLREDIYLRIQMQNRSHLDATKHELRWHPADLWRIALNIATTSATYMAWVQSILPGVERPWLVEEPQLRRLLFLLWGERIESGKNAYTANYILTRMSDANSRIFPRTLVQMLEAATDHERRSGDRTSPDRVLSHFALRRGVEHASSQRVEHLKTEYVELRLYLDALKEMSITGTEADFIKHMKLATKGTKDATLPRSAQGWHDVITRLRDVGVLGLYQQGNDNVPDRLAVAQLYRHGLGLKLAGLR